VKTLRWFPNTPAADPLVELVAQRLRVLGQPLRIKLLQALCEQPATVQELATGVGAVQQNVSQHLSILNQAGILTRHKDGTHVEYALADPHVIPLIDAAIASLARHSDELAKLMERKSGLHAD
jgi:DNA-binding transcriptional ArsR family regulator